MKHSFMLPVLTLSSVLYSTSSVGCGLNDHGYSFLSPDTIPLVKQIVQLRYNNKFITAWRTGLKPGDTLLEIKQDGSHSARYEKYAFNSQGAEFYQLKFSNSSEVFINSISAVDFNPDVPNFFYFHYGEATFYFQQNSTIYLNDSTYLWGLKGAVVNVHDNGDLPESHTAVSLLSGQGEIVQGKSTKRMAAGYQYNSRDTKLAKQSVDSADCVGWQHASFNYSNISYYELVYRISRWYDKPYAYADKNGVPQNRISFKGRFSDELPVIIDKLNKKKKGIRCSLQDAEIHIGNNL